MKIEPSKARILADCIESMAADAEDKEKDSFGIHLSLDDARMITRALSTAPTVDAVPVVRCKDCVSFEQKGKYPAGTPEYPDEMPYGYCYHWDYEQGMSPNQVDGNDFCSYGQRRDQSADVRNIGQFAGGGKTGGPNDADQH